MKHSPLAVLALVLGACTDPSGACVATDDYKSCTEEFRSVCDERGITSDFTSDAVCEDVGYDILGSDCIADGPSDEWFNDASCDALIADQ